MLKGSLYGSSDDVESVVVSDVVEAADDAVLSTVSAESGSSTCEGVGSSVTTGVTLLVAKGVNASLFGLVSGMRFDSCRFRNVFLTVGDVAESVSNLRLVEPLPKMGATLEVLRESLGLFEGEGIDSRSADWPYAIGAGGNMASDILLPLRGWMSGRVDDGGMRASMISETEDEADFDQI